MNIIFVALWDLSHVGRSRDNPILDGEDIELFWLMFFLESMLHIKAIDMVS